jgi:DNA-binding SARP family transcriptional activator
MRVRVLGQLTVTADDGTELPAGELPRRARQVLAVLAARHGRIQSKDALADAVWGDDLPGNHVAALEHYVSVIRRRLQPNDPASTCFIVTRSGGYVFDTGRVELDLADLRRRIRDLDLLPTGSPERLTLHEQILQLAGELPFPEDPYADWASSARSEVQVAAVTARLELAAAALPANAPRSLRLAQEAIELNPFLEPAYRAAMCAAVAMDRADDALRLFERLRKVLDDELGVAPSVEIVRLHREILAQRHQPEPEPVPLPPHRDRLSERFLGREAALRVLVEPDQPRVVHIVGPDGAGKSAFLDELSRHLVGRVGIGHGGSSIAVHRLAWLRAALVQLGATPQVLAVVDAAVPDRTLGREALELIGAMFERPEPVILAVDDAVDLDASSVAELSWLSRHYPSLRIVLTYRYPSQVATKPLAGLGTPVVMRLEPLTGEELAPFHDADVVELTGGIPALVAVARRLPEIRLAVAMQTARARTRWMPEPAWDVLRFCAVLGGLDATDLTVLTGRPMTEVLDCVDRLVHAHLLREDAHGLVGHRSSLIRDAVADQVSGVSSRALRERLAASSSR